jgi:hypothetical protein
MNLRLTSPRPRTAKLRGTAKSVLLKLKRKELFFLGKELPAERKELFFAGKELPVERKELFPARKELPVKRKELFSTGMELPAKRKEPWRIRKELPAQRREPFPAGKELPARRKEPFPAQARLFRAPACLSRIPVLRRGRQERLSFPQAARTAAGLLPSRRLVAGCRRFNPQYPDT